MLVLTIVFWICAALLVWTHAAYPLAARLLAAVRTRRVRLDDGHLPRVAVIVAAHNEESVIERRLANLRELDYPADRLEVVVTSDASSDRTDELAAAGGALVIANARGGKVAAQNNAVRRTEAEIVAFSDANCTWAPDALRKLVRNFADPEVGYVCGRLNLEADGRNKEGLYWRYELALRADESRLDSVTGGNGSIYAVRRSDYVEVDPRFGHDLSLPYLMVQRGRRAVYEAAANAYEKATPTTEDEYRRKVRMFEHCWAVVLEGRMLRGLRPLYLVELISHRHLRYLSGPLHVVGFVLNVALVGHGTIYAVALGLQLGVLLAALLGVGLPRYYVLVTWATVVALWNYGRRGVPATWEAAEGTR